MALKVAPGSDASPCLPDGEYGLGGEATLTRLVARGCPEEGSDGKWSVPENPKEHFIDFNVQVDDPNQGRVFVNTGPFGDFNTKMGDKAKSKAKVFLASIGLNAETVEFDELPDEKGNHALLGEDVCPMKVVVHVGIDKRGRNYLKSISRLT